MDKNVFLVVRAASVYENVVRELNVPGMKLSGGTSIADVDAAFDEGPIEHVIMGGGLDLDTRLAIVRRVFERSNTTHVHMNPPTGPQTFLPYRQPSAASPKRRQRPPCLSPRGRVVTDGTGATVSDENVPPTNEDNIREFRENGGRVASFGDAPLLLLTTLGAKSGQPRVNPMMYLADDYDNNLVYVFASAAGADKNPDWFYNLLAHPSSLVVEIGDEAVAAHAEILPEPLRTEIYSIQAARYPGFAAYERKTTRSIPVIALTLHRDRDG